MLAIYGGTFDPFHNGHLHLARAAVKAFRCPIRIIPNGTPPHRDTPCASWKDRYEMCRLATAGIDGISVTEDEKPPKTHYTDNTLAAIKRHHPNTTLLLVIGSDSYNTIHNWHAPERVLQLAQLIVVPRPDAPISKPLRWGREINRASELSDNTDFSAGGVYIWHCAPPSVSASQCRHAVSVAGGTGTGTAEFVPPAVADYITRHRLYMPS